MCASPRMAMNMLTRMKKTKITKLKKSSGAMSGLASFIASKSNSPRMMRKSWLKELE